MLKDYNDPSKTYTTPLKGYFNLPITYWEYGLSKKLRLREKFFYLLSIYEQEIAKPKLWWSKSVETMSEKYHIDEWTISNSIMELRRLDLIEVWYSKAVNHDDYASKKPSRYRLKELLSADVKEKLWSDLNEKYGVEMTENARKLAEEIDENNDIEIVKNFIRLIKKYNLSRVQEATKIISEYESFNPLRNTAYIEGVLKRMEKENIREKIT